MMEVDTNEEKLHINNQPLDLLFSYPQKIYKFLKFHQHFQLMENDIENVDKVKSHYYFLAIKHVTTKRAGEDKSKGLHASRT